MLYGKHLGFRGGFERKLAEGDAKAVELADFMARLKDEVRQWFTVGAVWRFLEAEADGNRLQLFAPGAAEAIHAFSLPRQPKADGLCLADLALPSRNGRRDSIALFVVGAGAGVRERADAARDDGEYLKSHALQALALETAEAAAEWLHAKLRADWGFPDPPELTMKDRFAARYRDKRYSFAYPACPDLDDQAGLFAVLDPGAIGVELTDGMMMAPEASVSALVFHHPDASYFSASGPGSRALREDPR